MTTLLIILLPILLSDMINPILFAGVVFGLGSRHPYFHAFLVLLSFFISYFLAGIAIAIGFDILGDVLDIPYMMDYILEFFVALLLFFSAYTLYNSTETGEEQLPHDKKMGAFKFCMMGLQINMIGLPLALPYLAAIDQILKADLPPIESILTLLVYNVIYILPFSSNLRCPFHAPVSTDLGGLIP